MSIEAISAVLSHSKAKGTVKLVLMGIAWHTGEDYERGAYPSQKTLASYANCSERQVRRALVELHESAEIEMLHHGGAGFNAERRSNRYWIRIDCPEECDNTLQHRTSTTQYRTSTTQ
jgi:hypothetical protein